MAETVQETSRDPVTLATDLIGHETVSPVDDPAIMEHIQNLLAEHEVDATIHERGGVYSLTAEIGSGMPCVCLNGHMDVVPAGNGWTVTDPFDPVVADGKLYGRGAADMKGGLAAQITAFIDLAQDDALSGSVTLMISGDEEVGSHNGTEPLVAELPQCDYAIVGEPTDMDIQVGARGLLWATVRLDGKSTHASRPHQVQNVMEDVPRVIDRLNALDLRHSTDDVLPDTTATVTAVESDGPYNSIPGTVEIGMDIRYTTGQTPDTIAADIRNALDGLDVDYALNLEDHGDAYQLGDDRFKQVATDVMEDLRDTAPRHVTDGGISDGKFFAAAGTPYIELGLRAQATGHQADEYCYVEDLHTMRQAYYRITKRLLS